MSPNGDERVLILGAAGRDFHDFNVYWKDRPNTHVVCFTATQIPDIADRRYPPSLAGPRYPDGIPIYDQAGLEELIVQNDISLVTLAYSDLPYDYVMHLAARTQAAGASFQILGAFHSMLTSTKPVIAVCAIRTGCGKSQTTRRICRILRDQGHRVAVVRHPMPYGDLTRQVCQRYARPEDMDVHHCTIEEREEYELHIEMGNVLYAGVDYGEILRQAEAEADVIVWDGGNNDLPFFRPDLHVVVTDPHRCGHEQRYYPGETNLRLADIVIINKVDTASSAMVSSLEARIGRIRPQARLVKADSPVSITDDRAIRGKRALVIEDGPTLTHGEMAYGAGFVAAKLFGAAAIVDPRSHAVGSIRKVFETYTHLSQVLPAMGYGERQIGELERTINAVPCDVVVVGTPIDLTRVLKIDKPAVRVRYELREHQPEVLQEAVLRIARQGPSRQGSTPCASPTASSPADHACSAQGHSGTAR